MILPTPDQLRPDLTARCHPQAGHRSKRAHQSQVVIIFPCQEFCSQGVIKITATMLKIYFSNMLQLLDLKMY